jgi:NAD(P)-dependent dehydrogenase (short-subunit alcohol dehydrogenase family)
MAVAITGPSNGGLGAQAAIDLASQAPHTILLLGRNLTKIQPVLDSIKSVSPRTIAYFVPIDLSSVGSVREAAQQVIDLVPHLDILINNAAVMALPSYETAPNFKSVELQFVANHLGHFLLTNLLLSLFPTTGQARIVNVSSEGHCFCAPYLRDISDINYSEGREYKEWEAYGMSKAANVLFTRSLAKGLESRGIRAYSLHPGNVIGTNLVANLKDATDWSVGLSLFAKSSE